MAVTYVIADLSYTTKFPKTYVWEHRGKGGTEKEGEKESRVCVGVYVIDFVKSSFFSKVQIQDVRANELELKTYHI